MPNKDMKVFAVMTKKGGAGKTTLTRAMLSAILADGKACLVVDADPQKALFRWSERVEIKNPNMQVVGIDEPAELENIIDDAYKNSTADFILIDTLGAGGAWADDIAVHSDYIILPIMLSETDMEIATDTFNWYRGLYDRAENPSALPSLAVVLARVDRSPSKAMLAIAKKANEIFPVIPHLFMERKQHADCDREGLLHDIADAKRSNINPLMRSHAKYFDEAVSEARDILESILEI